MGVLDELAEAEARVEALRRQVAQTHCSEVGHDWQFRGGANAGCGEGCGCSVPVHWCPKCGDCDYGDTEVADEIRRECADRRVIGLSCGEDW